MSAVICDRCADAVESHKVELGGINGRGRCRVVGCRCEAYRPRVSPARNERLRRIFPSLYRNEEATS